MSDLFSPRLALPFLQPGQAQKEVTHNEALQAVDMLVQPVAETAGTGTPPGAPAEGRCWIVAEPAVGAWAGRAGQIAQWTPGGWRFAVPAAGWRCHVRDRDGQMLHDGSGWVDDAVRADGVYVGGSRVVAARQPGIADPSGGGAPDAEARAAIGAILAALRAHGLIHDQS